MHVPDGVSDTRTGIPTIRYLCMLALKKMIYLSKKITKLTMSKKKHFANINSYILVLIIIVIPLILSAETVL